VVIAGFARPDGAGGPAPRQAGQPRRPAARYSWSPTHWKWESGT